MESYKHSCPFCGQHIEYTVGYCGRQMQCPTCGKTVTFPAVPPRPAGGSVKVKNAATRAAPRSAQRPPLLDALREFQHWNVIVQCAVPVVIVAALLAGALYVKKKFGEPAPDAAATSVQADPDAWQKTSELNKADAAVQARMKELCDIHAKLQLVQQTISQRRNLSPEEKQTLQGQAQMALKQQTLARKKFDEAFLKYSQLGGPIDYRSQIGF